MRHLLIPCCIALAVIAPLRAEDAAPTGEAVAPVSPIERFDTDKDGALSAAEIAAIANERQRARILALDTDGDGAVSAIEAQAYQPRERRNTDGGEGTRRPRPDGAAETPKE